MKRNSYWREQGREYYHTLKRLGVCVLCKGKAEIGGVRCRQCLIKINDKKKEQKKEVFKHYGSKCVCCSEELLSMLTIDHVFNDGNKHRKSIKSNNGKGHGMYRWLTRQEYPKEFQVLCWNCNVSKHINGGTCEHVSDLV